MKKHLSCLFGPAVVLLLGSCGKKNEVDLQPAGPLLATHWRLAQVDNTPVETSSYSPDYASYIQFSQTGSVARGLAACNTISGKFAFTADTHQLTITQLSPAQSSCSSPFLSDRYLTALSQTTSYEIDGVSLRLYDAQGAARLQFFPSR